MVTLYRCLVWAGTCQPQSRDKSTRFETLNLLISSFHHFSYYHGTYSRIEMSGVQYIHEDVRWKDTGYESCADVKLVSALYYSTMAAAGVYILCSIIGWVVSLVGSVCAKPVSIHGN